MDDGEIVKQLMGIANLQAQHSVLLAEHMRRTEALESSFELMRAELSPIKTHVAIWGVIGKIIGALGVLTGIATGVLQFLR